MGKRSDVFRLSLLVCHECRLTVQILLRPKRPFIHHALLSNYKRNEFCFNADVFRTIILCLLRKILYRTVSKSSHMTACQSETDCIDFAPFLPGWKRNVCSTASIRSCCDYSTSWVRMVYHCAGNSNPVFLTASLQASLSSTC